MVDNKQGQDTPNTVQRVQENKDLAERGYNGPPPTSMTNDKKSPPPPPKEKGASE